MDYREIKRSEIAPQLFKHFDRYQNVTKCWRKENGEWVIRDVPFVEQWGEEDYAHLVTLLRNTVQSSGVVFGAISGDALKGFASVEGRLFGVNRDYLDLSSIHVSYDMRGHGIGKALFHMAANWAKTRGAKKLYISAHSSVESQAFYRSMGCVEAMEYDHEHVLHEPFDCQLEFDLS